MAEHGNDNPKPFIWHKPAPTSSPRSVEDEQHSATSIRDGSLERDLVPAGNDKSRTLRSWVAERGWLVPLLVGIAAFHAVFVWRTSLVIDNHRTFVLFDDAMISMRYARNLASGHGLVWNAGGPRVEGITNPAWTLWMAVVHLLPLPDRLRSLPVMISSSVLVLGTVVSGVRLTEVLVPNRRLVSIMAGVALATFYPYTYWSLRGTEVGLLGFLSVTAVLLVVSDPALDGAVTRRWLPVALVLMVLTRLDAVVLAGLVVAGGLMMAPAGRRGAVLARLGGTLGATLIAVTGFRMAYYGDPLPNTYYLKATGVALSTRVDQGRFFLQRIALVNLGPYLVFALGAVLAIVRRRDRRLLLVVAMVLSQAAYSVWAGGDAWEDIGFANRYLSTVAPLLMVAAAVGLAEWATSRQRARLLRLAGLSLVSGLFLFLVVHAGEPRHVSLPIWTPAPGLPGIRHWRYPLGLAAALLTVGGVGLAVIDRTVSGNIRRHERFGRYGPSLATGLLLVGILGANQLAWRSWWVHNAPYVDLDKLWARDGFRYRRATKPNAVIAFGAAGSPAYFSDRPAIDLLGKSDKHIAHMAPATTVFRPGHNKFDAKYSINLRPDLVQGPVIGAPPTGYHVAAGGELVRNDTRRVNEAKLARTALGSWTGGP